MPEVPVRQIRFVMCQRTRRVRLQVHQRPCQADPENQTRSHSENNEELSWSTRTAAFLHMQWKPRKSWWGRGRTVSTEKTEWKEATPPSSSTSPGTSSTPHFIWNAVLNGITDAFLRVCWLFRHMLCLIIQPRKSRSWKKQTHWSKDVPCYSTPLYVGAGKLLTNATTTGRRGQRWPSATEDIIG